MAGLLLAAVASAPLVSAKERREVPKGLTWDLEQIYPSADAWQTARHKVTARLPELGAYQSHLGEPGVLWTAFSKLLEIRKELERVNAYAYFLADQDTRDSKNAEMRSQAQQLMTDFEAATAYFRPELLALGEAKVKSLIAAEPRLAAYQPVFDDILRNAPHTLSSGEEKLVAQAGDIQDSGQAVHSVFTDADLPYPEIQLKNGQKVRLDAAGYTKYRADGVRDNRLKVFKAFWSRYNEFRRTLAATLYAQVKGHLYDKSVHNYKSCLDAALFPNNVPPEVYHQLLKDVHANLPTLHRYLKLRRRLMGLKQLGYEDLYAPIIQGVDLKYTPEEAKKLTLEAAAPLGEEYVKVLSGAYQDRWVDFLPSTGKRSGAYSSGDVYDLHPYQLLNFNGNYEDVSTLSHESGHSMHSYLSNKNQPYGLNAYPIFVAEVASTLNENMLFHYMLERTQDKKVKLSLLGSYLENMRGTLFRQTLLAEFELKVHEMAEQGQPLTGDNLNALYLKLLRDYYGHDQGVCRVDELYAIEWGYIPHFFYNFYVFQYATSQVASTSIAKSILAGQPGAREAYLKMLSSGNSDYPLTLLQKAGVDMTTSKPFEAAMAEMNHIMDEIEKISPP
ncbi:MAG: oligoendopeptidase F [Candidatus Eremiobacteraeota bacterium]|nr:oligoendopeptidase F [Candidatus Eremiobacteraeota bacterium]